MASKINIPNFDMYSKRTSFFFNNHEKISSIFGYFLTFVYICASLVLFFYQIIIAIKKKELKVYDTTIYAQEMPILDVDSKQLYFAFGLEDPLTSSRFVDESIYTPKIVFVDKLKINDEFQTVFQKTLEYEKCKVENFGKDYQHLFIKDELNNSYCLKDFNYNITFAGGYKYERMTYIRIRIYPCVNSSSNNYSCKPQYTIDRYMTSGYFSIILKDFGLNPSNYSFPVLPTLQDLYTTIDKRLYRNYILNFGITEIHTDTGIFNENLNITKYLQFRKELQTFSFRDEEEYYSGKSVILIQLKLDDTLVVQKRAYTKISEIFSRIGGYMQLMNTAFLLISTITNKFHCELKIINSIFNFNIKENKMILKLNSLKEVNSIINSNNYKNLKFSFNKSLKSLEIEDKSKNNLILKDNDCCNLPSEPNINDNINNKKINENKNYTIKINKKNNLNTYENPKNDSSKAKSEINQNIKNSLIISKENSQKNNYSIENNHSTNIKNYNEKINLSFIDLLCPNKNSKKYKYIEFYNHGNSFYKKKMDIVHVFTLHSIIEKFIIKNNYHCIYSLCKEI